MSFTKSKLANSEKTYRRKDGQTIGRTGRRTDPLPGPFWPCLGAQQEKSQKKSQIKYSLATLNTARTFVGNRHDIREGGGVRTGEEGRCYLC